MIRAEKTVTKCVTNVLANEGKAGALSLILSPKGGQVRAVKSTPLGNLAKAGVIEGNVLFGLITQRSKVQILPPQVTHSTWLIILCLLYPTSDRSTKVPQTTDSKQMEW